MMYVEAAGCLLLIAVFVSAQEETEPELAPLDGWYNNLLHPDWGAVDTILLRKSPTAYADGVYHMAGPTRPNPFEISKVAHRGIMGLGSERGRTALMTYYGQQVVEEMLDVQRPGCPREYENIVVPDNDPLYTPGIQMPFTRSRFDARTGQSPSNPRQQLNEITPYLDGQLMYGPAKAWTDAIRAFEGGRLKALDGKYTPIKESFPAINDIRLPFANPPNPREQTREERLQPVARFWRLGNPRGFENPFLLSFGVMWFRLHNFWADMISQEHPDYTDEALFTEARKWVVAMHQKITVYDWLPRWLEILDNGSIYNISDTVSTPERPTCPYKGYNPNIHPGITHEFQSSAMRYGHTLVTPGLWRRGTPQGPVNQLRGDDALDNCNWTRTSLKVPGQVGDQVHAFRLCNSYWNSQESVVEDVDSLFRGMASTLGEREDHIMVADLAGDVFGPLEFSRRDLAALNIQRGRDHGLPDYQAVREAFDLPRLKSWEDINPTFPANVPASTVEAIAKLQQLYIDKGLNGTTPEDVDLFTGGLMETTFDGPGPLFRAILVDQFCRVRDGDRFWYENLDNGLFSQADIDRINSFTIFDIIKNVTNVDENQIQTDPFIHKTNDICPQPQQLNISTTINLNGQSSLILEDCTGFQTYDYFFNSEYSFALTFLAVGLCIPATVGIMILLAKRRIKSMTLRKKKVAKKFKGTEPNVFDVLEWVGHKEGERNIKVRFDSQRRKIHVSDRRGKPLRMIDLRQRGEHQIRPIYVWLEDDHSLSMCSVRAEGEIDLILQFADMEDMAEFVQKLETFLNSINVEMNQTRMRHDIIINNAQTKDKRQKLLDQFFRIVSLQAFKGTAEEMAMEPLDQDTAKQLADIKLTRTEFAEAFGLKPTSMFVRNMFLLVDSDKSGFVNFREFLDFFVVLSSQDSDSKVQLIFNMYDIGQKGVLSKSDFSKMIMSLLDLSDSSLDKSKVTDLISSMYRVANVREGSEMTFTDFKKIFEDEEYAKTLANATLDLDGMSHEVQTHDPRKKHDSTLQSRSKTLMRNYDKGGKSKGLSNRKRGTSVRVTTTKIIFPKTKTGQLWFQFTSWVATYQLVIFWTVLYTLTLVGIFAERAFYYSVEREHAGLRRIAGYGVTITRGAASAMMFTYCPLLITMSRNLITFFRETSLHRFFPWDSMHFLHKYIAFWALFFTMVHVVGHSINLYHISTQSSGDLNCIFREYFRAQDVLASFHYWAYTTITGLTGIILTLIVIIMYVFAMPYARRYVFNAFWTTHKFYVLLYIFNIMHGSGRLVQPPLFWLYFLPCLFIFILDKMISVSRNKIQIAVVSADLLPSDVTALVFKRPASFEYKSGQWVRIASLDLGKSEYHPFTLTSAPHEEHLSLHIRAVGPWTTNIRELYDPDRLEYKKYKLPKLFLDGPYGEGHQDWYRFPVAILVGGGIGVTPFASILKDIVHKSKIDDFRFPCKKVYFLWVTRTQKQFEWMTDIIREVENNDLKSFVDVHIFITQFKEKFDFRTTMLYICERHFQKVAGKSLFTGLSATTHFGRPQFQDILRSIGTEHPKVNRVGVFSCGPPPMTNTLDKTCSDLNKIQGTIFKHHFENF
ncbi:dual oxidase 2-like isoform X1 [Mizuhopecten yessoensis]|uniref:NAD(P)H oxidase (H2O2-forming) n=1 Tax=Mizuhopecten yessoensis TaxID=6573 RepID=A0A210QZA7_MIZYE|nr:dual oxidase 2-like isoform X1 [Mizuhopecten yessoensis]OWF54042.1 Dual oxidase 2 [Mizuhopecten yessoensis]